MTDVAATDAPEGLGSRLSVVLGVSGGIAAYKAAGVTHLSVNPIGPDPVKTVELLRTMLD